MSKTHMTYQQRGYVRRNGHERLDAVMPQCATLYKAASQERRELMSVCTTR